MSSDWLIEGEDGSIQEMTSFEFAAWRTANPELHRKLQRVAEDIVDGLRVSTVCLFLDHGWDGVPYFYETLVFDWRNPEKPNWSEIEGQRYTSRAAAAFGHAEFVERVRSGDIKPPEVES